MEIDLPQTDFPDTLKRGRADQDDEMTDEDVPLLPSSASSSAPPLFSAPPVLQTSPPPQTAAPLSAIREFYDQYSPDLEVYEDQNDSRLTVESSPKAHPFSILVALFANLKAPPSEVLLATSYLINWSKSSTVFDTPEGRKAFKTAVGKINAAGSAATIDEFSSLYFKHPLGYVPTATFKTHSLATYVATAVDLGDVAVVVSDLEVKLERPKDVLVATRSGPAGRFVGPKMTMDSGDANFESSAIAIRKAQCVAKSEVYYPLDSSALHIAVQASIRNKTVPSFLQPLTSLAINARLTGGGLRNPDRVIQVFLSTLQAATVAAKVDAMVHLRAAYQHVTNGLHPLYVEPLSGKVPGLIKWMVPSSVPRRPTSLDYMIIGAPFCNFWTIETVPPSPACYLVNPYQFDHQMCWLTGFPSKFISEIRATAHYVKAVEIHDESIALLYEGGPRVTQRPSLAALDEPTKALCELALSLFHSDFCLPNKAPISNVLVPFDLTVKPSYARNFAGMRLLGLEPRVKWVMDEPWLYFDKVEPCEADDAGEIEKWAEAWMADVAYQACNTLATMFKQLVYPTGPYRVHYCAKDLATSDGAKTHIANYVKQVQAIAFPTLSRPAPGRGDADAEEKAQKRLALQQKMAALKVKA